MRYIYLVGRDNSNVKDYFYNKKDAIEQMKAWAGCGAVWIDRLPKRFFKFLDKEFVEDIFDSNQKEVEAVASIDWE